MGFGKKAEDKDGVSFARSISDNYEIVSKIFESPRSVVYRAKQKKDGVFVIIKMLQEDCIGQNEILRYQHEFDILNKLNIDGVIKVYGIRKYEGTPYIVFEDINGVPLSDLLQPGLLTIEKKLELAIIVSSILGKIHDANIIHKDINPSNIVINLNSRALRVIDFGISTMLEKEETAHTSISDIEGSLNYISPEQSGKMNRSVDFRADFYSFGVSLYELFTGKLPFNETDPLKLIHYHIAKQPLAPKKIDQSIPVAISNIIMKLMAKMAEDRYQSAWGVRADLLKCLRQLISNGRISQFQLGQVDVSDKFIISEKNYGRNKELHIILDLFNRACNGNCQIAFISGPAGIGKTALAKEIQKSTAARRGYFISGNYDRFQGESPYSAIINALRDLIKQIVSEDAACIGNWRNEILKALGQNGQIVIDVIPELELVLGKQPTLCPLGSLEAQRFRFNQIFQNFIKVFCRKEHPLVIFLDDLQWIDKAPIELLFNLVKDNEIQYLFIIGAYRDDINSKVALLIESLNTYACNNFKITNIKLGSLHIGDISQLIEDALRCEKNEARELARLVVTKTAGNPFFIREFIKSLSEQNKISYDHENGRWKWNIDQLSQCNITDNVVVFLTERMKRLDTKTQKILKIAALIGQTFELSTLTEVLEESSSSIIVILNKAILEGLIIPIGDGHRMIGSMKDYWNEKIEYKFSHDGICHAAISLVSNSEAKKIRLRIGETLLRSKQSIATKLFEIVNQLNLCIDLITDTNKREKLANLNLKAGVRSKSSMANEIALGYLEKGIALLTTLSWKTQYELTLKLHHEAAECAFLLGKFNEMDRYIKSVLENAKSILDKIGAYETEIQAQIAKDNMNKATDIGIEILGKLGLSLPEKFSKIRLVKELIRVKLALIGKTDNDIQNLREMTDPMLLARSRIWVTVAHCLYFTKRWLLPFVFFDAVRMSIKHGNSASSPYAYTCYGMLFCGKLNNIRVGYQFGRLGSALLKKFDAKIYECATLMCYNNFVRHWKEHPRNCLEPLLHAYKTGLECGDLKYAAQSATSYCYFSFFCGKNLNALDSDMLFYSSAITKMNQEGGAYILKIYHQVVANLLGRSQDPAQLEGEYYQSNKMLMYHFRSENRTGIFATFLMKTILFYTFEKFAQALECAIKAKEYSDNPLGLVNSPIFYFYYSLTLIANFPNITKSKRNVALKDIRGSLKKLKSWAQSAPINHKHRCSLIEAELARLRKDQLQAQNHYENAIDLLAKSGYVNEMALANELAAKYYLKQERKTVAVAYMKKARYHYERWGAVAKIKHMDQKYAYLMLTYDKGRPVTSSFNTISKSTIDIATLKQSLEAISKEKIHSKMVGKIISAAIQFAGAQKGLLLLRKGDQGFFVEAEGSVDKPNPVILQSVSLEGAAVLPRPVINYVMRTRKSIVILDAQNSQSELFGLQIDDYITKNDVKSILCMPIVLGVKEESELIGILYLENNRITGAFTEEQIEILEIICLAAASRVELSLKAATDGLTGLYNHEYFQNLLQKEIMLSQRQPRDLSLIMIDIDHFKSFNDSWGHQVGDDVLKAVAQCVQGVCRKADIVARYGGEEISVILPDASLDAATVVAERIRDSIEDTTVLYGSNILKVTASIGVSTLKEGIFDKEALIKVADDALYEAKNSGRNRVIVGV